MPSDDFPNAPDMGTEFYNNRLVDPKANQHDKPKPEPIHYPDLDHLELNLDYTPGGSLEQDVHTQLSENARRDYNAQMQKTEPSREVDYLTQVQEKLKKQQEAQRQEREAKEVREEAEAREAEQKEQREKTADRDEKEQQSSKAGRDWKAASYDMPEQGEDSSAPASPPPPSPIRPRPGRLSGDFRDRCDDGHER